MALLGWSIADDRDVFSIPEMVEAFEIGRVNPNPARFDIKKAEAINGSHIRLLSESDLCERLVPYFQAAGLIDATPTETQLGYLAAATPLVHERMTLLTEAVDMLRFLFISDEDFTVDEADARQEPGRRRPGGRSGPPATPSPASPPGRVDHRDDRGRAARRADRRARAQAAPGIRAGSRCGDGKSDLSAAVRVARAAGSPQDASRGWMRPWGNPVWGPEPRRVKFDLGSGFGPSHWDMV